MLFFFVIMHYAVEDYIFVTSMCLGCKNGNKNEKLIFSVCETYVCKMSFDIIWKIHDDNNFYANILATYLIFTL